MRGLVAGVPVEPRRSPRSPTGPLVNIGLLERELGSVEYRLAKLAARAPGRAELEAQKAQLIQAIDRERERLPEGSSA